jgi:hypothetical protein
MRIGWNMVVEEFEREGISSVNIVDLIEDAQLTAELSVQIMRQGIVVYSGWLPIKRTAFRAAFDEFRSRPHGYDTYLGLYDFPLDSLDVSRLPESDRLEPVNPEGWLLKNVHFDQKEVKELLTKKRAMFAEDSNGNGKTDRRGDKSDIWQSFTGAALEVILQAIASGEIDRLVQKIGNGVQYNFRAIAQDIDDSRHRFPKLHKKDSADGVAHGSTIDTISRRLAEIHKKSMKLDT